MCQDKIEQRKLKFIEKAKEIHKNENLDYSKVVYINNRTPVCIIDHDIDENGHEYGEYYMSPNNHLKGQSHPSKRGKKIHESKKFTTEEIIKKFKEVHGNLYDYSKVVYVNMHTPVTIIDPLYGEFTQEPAVHLKGCGNKLRAINKKVESSKLTNDELIKRFISVHGNLYDYSKVKYKSYKEPVIIICRKHGEFEQTPDAHIQGKGCPKCGNHYSKYDEEIANFVKEHGYNVDLHNHTILDGKEIDVYIPELKTGIEFHGLRWHTEWFGGKGRNYHLEKLIKCKEKGIKLIQIFEDEYINNREIVYSKIKHLIKIDNNLERIPGRKCKILEIEKETAKEFLDRCHIQGFVGSSIYLGAFYSNKLIGVMSFTKKDKCSSKYELTRFASDYHYICQGVGGRLFNFFVRNYHPIEIQSFADRRWTINEENNIYIILGFKFDSYTKPEYRYYRKEDGYIRHHKFGFRKDRIHRKYGLQLTMTETEMVKELGYDRIWDCGLIKYVWKNENSSL